MHIWTHLQKKYEDLIAYRGFYGAGMAEFDDHVGVLLKKLDDLGIANNTIVMFSSDNGAETFTWPDYLARRRHDTVPQRKRYQLGRRVPRPLPCALARNHPARNDSQRYRRP
jgi:arylsulfatase A-like enzyme